MHVTKRLGAVLAAAMLAALTIGPGVALAAGRPARDRVHQGLCQPDQDGDPYTCAYSVRNILDEAEDTLTIDSLATRPRRRRRRELGQHPGRGPDRMWTAVRPASRPRAMAPGHPLHRVTSCTDPVQRPGGRPAVQLLHRSRRPTSGCPTISSRTTPTSAGTTCATTRPGPATRTATRTRRPSAPRR